MQKRRPQGIFSGIKLKTFLDKNFRLECTTIKIRVSLNRPLIGRTNWGITNQGYPTKLFCNIPVRRSKTLLRIFYTLR